MNCTFKRYFLLDKKGNKTKNRIRELWRKGKLVKSDGDIQKEDYYCYEIRYGKGEVQVPGFIKDRRKEVKLAQYFGCQVPPKKINTITETVTHEDGTTEEVTKLKPKGKRGKKARYSDEDIRILAEEIIKSGLTFAEYIVKVNRATEKAAIYAKLRGLKLEVPMGKRGRQKGWKKS